MKEIYIDARKEEFCLQNKGRVDRRLPVSKPEVLRCSRQFLRGRTKLMKAMQIKGRKDSLLGVVGVGYKGECLKS